MYLCNRIKQKKMSNKQEDNQSKVDPFLVEAVVRECFDIKKGQETPEGVNISYNDLINYTTYIIQLAFDSYDKKSQEFVSSN